MLDRGWMLRIISSEATRKLLKKIPFGFRAVWVINKVAVCYFMRKIIIYI